MRLFALSDIIIRTVNLLQITGEIDAQRLPEDSRRSKEIDQHSPPLGCQPDLLCQLTLDGREIALTFHVQQSRRRLDQPVAYRMPILPDQSHPVMIIKCDHSHGTWVLEVLARDQLSIWRDYLVLHITGDLALGEHDRRLDGPGEWHISQLVGTENDHRWLSSTGSRVASLRSSAASTRPTKSGCGRVGRDLSSGCAWVATK